MEPSSPMRATGMASVDVVASKRRAFRKKRRIVGEMKLEL
jgi:hypothetical protein